MFRYLRKGTNIFPHYFLLFFQLTGTFSVGGIPFIVEFDLASAEQSSNYSKVCSLCNIFNFVFKDYLHILNSHKSDSFKQEILCNVFKKIKYLIGWLYKARVEFH